MEADKRATSGAASSPDHGPAWRVDLVAGVTTGVLAVPQGIAFALLAGVPPEHGVYAMIVPTIVAALVRSSPFLVTGATNTSALVVGALLAALSPPRGEIVPLMLLITLLMGLFQIAAGALRLGRLGRYVSQAVLVGFTLGAATLIVSGQLSAVLGLSAARTPYFLDGLAHVARSVSRSDPRALAIAGLTWTILWAGSRVSRSFPGALLAIAAGGLAVALLGWDHGPEAVRLAGEVPRRLPGFTFPAHSFAHVRQVLGASVAVAILGMVEAVSIGRSLSAVAGVRFFPDQELAAKGLGNVAGAFFGCLPTSASWTRSAINLQMGARTRWVGVVAGVTVLVAVLALAPLSRHVPEASLGAIIVWIGVRMVDLRAARWVWRWSRADGVVLVVTLGATLLVQIQYAIYIGVLLSLAMLVRRVGSLHMVEMAEATPGQFREIEIDDETGKTAIVLLQLEGDLFFGVVEELEEQLARIATNGARAIILRMKRAHAIDATAADALAGFASRFRASGGRILICGLRADLLERIQRSRLGDALGPKALLPTTSRPFASVRSALDLARRDVSNQSRPPGAPLVRRAPREAGDASSYSI